MPEAAYVDREMWEKIVLNLLSNAFKFTLEGEISVRLRDDGPHVELVVSDTGTGIPAEALPRMFERFHRVENARGRSHEGSGIGLALVNELVKLHGGSIAVREPARRGHDVHGRDSQGQRASAGRARQGSARDASPTRARADAYVAEALGWLPRGGERRLRLARHAAQRVLLADDNADLREYVRRLLAEHYDVRGRRRRPGRARGGARAAGPI